MIETIFKKKRIIYDEDTNKWICSELELEVGALAALKDKITKFFSSEFKQQNIKVIVDSWSNWVMGVVTSITDEGEIWIKNHNGSRTKERSERVYQDCEKNRDHIKKMQEYERKRKELSSLVTEEQKKMTHFSIESVEKDG